MALDWGSKRKLMIIGSIAGVVIIVLGIFSYFTFFNDEPTCFDGKANQDERGVDCGGKCLKVCTADTRSIVRLWSQTFSIAPGVGNAVAYIENQNPGAGARSIRYEFRVYDDQNLLISQPVTGETFLESNTRTAIFISGIETGNRIPASTFFRILSEPKWEKIPQKFLDTLVVTTGTTTEGFDAVPKVFSTLQNVSLYDLKDIEVVAVLYDANGNAVSASRTFVDKIAKQSSVPISFTWQESFPRKVIRVELIPRVNPFQ